MVPLCLMGKRVNEPFRPIRKIVPVSFKGVAVLVIPYFVKHDVGDKSRR